MNVFYLRIFSGMFGFILIEIYIQQSMTIPIPIQLAIITVPKQRQQQQRSTIQKMPSCQIFNVNKNLYRISIVSSLNFQSLSFFCFVFRFCTLTYCYYYYLSIFFSLDFVKENNKNNHVHTFDCFVEN